MNKRKIVKEIINPYMDKNGFTLEKYERGDWSYRKKIDEALLEINIADANGRLHMHIGVYGRAYDVQAEQFIDTLPSARTSMMDWDYGWIGKTEEEKEKLFRDILYDYRDILELNGDRIFEKIVTDYKNRLPNRKHYLLMLEHYDELEQKYRKELCPEECDILELWEKVAAWVENVRKDPLEEIAERLVGYVTVLETEMIKRYGGKRENDSDREACVIYAGKNHQLFNFLSNFFWLWQHEDMNNREKREMENWYNEQK